MAKRSPPKRPPSLPKTARWNNKDKEWEDGDYNEGRSRIGEWRGWRPDGTLAWTATYSPRHAGALHGRLNFYLPDGRLQRWEQYKESVRVGARTLIRSDAEKQEDKLKKSLSLAGDKLAQVLAASGMLVPSSKLPKHPVFADSRHFAAPWPRELCDLVAAFRRNRFNDLEGEAKFRPFYFEDEFLFGGGDEAAKQITRAAKLGWPPPFAGHFWGLYPIGEEPGGNCWLAHLMEGPRGSSRVFCYNHDDYRLSFAHHSISELVYDTAFVSRDPNVDDHPADGIERKFRASRKGDKLEPHDDPLELARRSAWLTALLAGEALDRALLRDAPSLAVWSKEKTLLATRPHLSLYWLIAHALLGNRQALRQALDATAKSTHSFVRSLRKLVTSFDAAATTPSFGPLKGPPFADELAKLRNSAPRGLLEAEAEERKRQEQKTSRQDRRQQSQAQEKMVAEAEDPQALMQASPDDVKLHVRALKQMSQGADRGFVSQVAILEQLVAGKRRLHYPIDPDLKEFLATIDQRFLLPVSALVRQGFAYEVFHPKAFHLMVKPLGRLGGPRALETLLAGFRTTFDSVRHTGLLRALATSDDPRVIKAALAVAKNALAETAANDVVPPLRAAIDILCQRQPGEAAAVVMKALKRGGFALDAAIDAAGKLRLPAAMPFLRAMIEKQQAVASDIAQAASALVAIDRKSAESVLFEMWNQRAADRDWNKPEALAWRRGICAALLRGLLLLRPKETDYLENARVILRYHEAGRFELEAIRHVLDAIRDAHIKTLAADVRPWLRHGMGSSLYEDDEDYVAMRARAKATLDALGQS